VVYFRQIAATGAPPEGSLAGAGNELQTRPEGTAGFDLGIWLVSWRFAIDTTVLMPPFMAEKE
jgi:hypothetical protein